MLVFWSFLKRCLTKTTKIGKIDKNVSQYRDEIQICKKVMILDQDFDISNVK